MRIFVKQTRGLERLQRWCVAHLVALILLVVGPNCFAQEAPGVTTPITTPTDDRVLSLLDIGNSMLVDGRSTQAYSHFQNFALQFPGSGPLMQAWAQSARAADRLNDLLDATTGWDGQNGRPSQEMAVFIRAYLALFELDTRQSADVIQSSLEGVQSLILDSGLRVDQSSNLQLLLSMIALRDDEDWSASILRAKSHIDTSRQLDPGDPTINQLADVIAYLSVAQALVDQGQPLGVDNIANAGLEIGAIQSSRLPGAIRARSAALMQTLVSQQPRDQDMPREYLRGLVNVIALEDLGEQGAYTAADTWYAAGDLPDFQQSIGFQGYGSFLGRFVSCYVDPTAGLNLLSRLEAIQYEQSKDLKAPDERVVAERRLETLVLLWRFATRMRLGDEAREFRDEARALSETLEDRTRANAVSGPWVLPILATGGGLILVALISLLAFFVRARPRPMMGLQNSQIAVRVPAVGQLTRRIGAIYARLALRHCLSTISYSAGVLLWFVLLGFGLLAAAAEFFPDLYRQLYGLTDTRMLGAMALGLALLIGAIMGMFAIGRPRLAPGRLASSVDQHLGLGGVTEVIYRLPQVASWSGRSPDFVSENKYLLDQLPQAVHQINPSRLIRLGRPVILAASLLMMLSAAAAGYQFLPLPKYDPVALPNPQICPAPSNNQAEPPPPASLQNPETVPVDGDGATGLDVTNSSVPEQQIPDLEFELGVGGTDDVGEPFDYHTTLPSREFDVQRREDGRGGLGQAGSLPDGLADQARQNIPERFLGLQSN